jgi:hypothetical protein
VETSRSERLPAFSVIPPPLPSVIDTVQELRLCTWLHAIHASSGAWGVLGNLTSQASLWPGTEPTSISRTSEGGGSGAVSLSTDQHAAAMQRTKDGSAEEKKSIHPPHMAIRSVRPRLNPLWNLWSSPYNPDERPLAAPSSPKLSHARETTARPPAP